MGLSRREFGQIAAAMGAAFAWGGPVRASKVGWAETRDLYPEGVASGDPDSNSVILWTRRPFGDATRHALTVEVSEDEAFSRVPIVTETFPDHVSATVARRTSAAKKGGVEIGRRKRESFRKSASAPLSANRRASSSAMATLRCLPPVQPTATVR